MDIVSIVCMFVIMACGIGIIADTAYECIEIVRARLNGEYDEEES